MSDHCEGVCTPDPMVCALVYGSTREVRRGYHGQESLIFMHFHEVFLGSQHEIWSEQHNGKVSSLLAMSSCSFRNTIKKSYGRTMNEKVRKHGPLWRKENTFSQHDSMTPRFLVCCRPLGILTWLDTLR